MKKKLNLLVLSSALMLGLASCGGGETASSSVADSGTAETSSVASAETDYVAYAEAAYATISATYDDWAKGITTNQKIYLKATYGGVEFTVSYTISEAAKAYLSISGEELVVTTDSEDHALAGAVTVTLSYNGNTYYSKALNVKVSALAIATLEEMWAMKDGDSLTTRGKVTATYGKSFFMQDGSYGTEVYTNDDFGVAVGDYVEVNGAVSVYNGLYEIKPTTVTKLSAAGSVADPVAVDLDASDVDLSVAKNIAARTFEGENLYVKSINVGAGSSGYHYIEGKLTLGGKEGTTDLAMRIDDRYASAADLATWGWTVAADGTITLDGTVEAGDTIAASGVLTWYNNAQVALGTITKVTKGEKIVAKEIAIADLYKTGDDLIADDTLVKLSGKVTANYNAASQGGFFIADGEYGAYIYRAALPEGIAVGDYVSLEGTVSTYKGTKEITGAAEITKLADGTGITDPVSLDGTATLTATNQSRPISVTGKLTEISSDNYGNVSGKLAVGENSYSFKYDTRYVDLDNLAEVFGWAKAEDAEGKATYSITAKVGGTVTIKGVSTYASDAGSIIGVTASDYTAPVESTEPDYEEVTVAEALALGNDTISTVAYKITGVLEDFGNSDYGTANLTDPATGDTIALYSFSNDKTNLTWGGTAYTWKSGKEALATFKDAAGEFIVGNGDVVTVVGIYSPYKGTPQMKAFLSAHEDGAANLTASASAAEENTGSVELSKTSGITYGEEITVTATPADGYVVSTAVVTDAQGTETDITEALKFNATAWNEVKVTFVADDAPVTKTVTINTFANTGTLNNNSTEISWTVGAATFASQKAESSTSLRTSDSDHYRIYKSATASVTVESATLDSVVITCTSADYASVLAGLTFTGATAAADGAVVTLTPTEGVSEITIGAASAQYRVSTVAVTYTEAAASSAKELPVVSSGNAGDTKIEGAGAWIYLDNSELAISGANSADIVAASSVNLTVTAPAGSEHTDYATGGSAAIAVRSFQFDDYNADASVVRLYVNMTAGVDASWNFTHTFTINLVIGDATYAGTVTFTANAYVAA